MYKNFDLGVVIPVRLGSSRVSQKALLPVGKEKISLLAWKIRQLKKVISSNNIYVSTEADILKEIAISEGVKIHNRDGYLADGHKASFSEVITGIVKDIPHEHIAWVTCVVPLMSPQEYLQGFREYKENVLPEKSTFNSLVSVNLLKEYFWNDDEPINYSATKKHTISQELPNMYRVTNGLYMASKRLILENEYLLGNNPYKSCVSKIAGIDIDEYEDYEIARELAGIYDAKEESKVSEAMVFLDFDGVIFDSAKEAYAIAMLTNQKIKSLTELDFETEHAKRFLAQRYLIGPAWNYCYLLDAIDENREQEFIDNLPEEAGEKGKQFQAAFFATRQVIRNNFWDEWIKLNTLYDGGEEFIQLINENTNIVIVTTKDSETVKTLLKANGLKRSVAIYDTTAYEKFGCKSYFIDDYMNKNNIKRAIFVDDSSKHLSKCSWVDNLHTEQACWGYVEPSIFKDNKKEVIRSINHILLGG
jgi:CMP-N-acetylneuraminic acid synthetase/phosphoglycolate phosphatase-like HAD superfamily hydrolase